MRSIILLCLLAIAAAALASAKKAPPQKKRRVVVSAFSAGLPEPIAFKWTDILSQSFSTPSRQYVLLLHGANLPYGLSDAYYRATHHNVPNPFQGLLQTFVSRGVLVKICELCLVEAHYNNTELLPFVTPVPFSIDYIIDEQFAGSAIVYDSPVNVSLVGVTDMI